MKWKVLPDIETTALGWFMIVEVDTETGVVGGFRTQEAAERAVADHNLLEWFADPERAIELLMTVARDTAKGDGPSQRHQAIRVLADPALQAPKEKP